MPHLHLWGFAWSRAQRLRGRARLGDDRGAQPLLPRRRQRCGVSSPRLSEAVSSLLAHATEEARRRGHRTAEAEHLLAALADCDDHASLLLDRGVDRAELRLLVDATLAAWAPPSSYRDGVARVPTLAVGLVEQLGTKRGSWLGRLRPVDVEELVEVLASHGSCGSILRRSTSIVQSLVATLRRARAVTEAPSVSVEHVLRLLADERWFVFAIRAAGGDIDQLRVVLDDAIATRATHGADDEGAAELSTLIQRTLSHAKVMGQRAMADLFVVRAVQIARVAKLFDSAGVRPSKLVLVLVHGEMVVDDDARDLGASEPCEVVFHDDERTPMEIVVEVLVTCFDMDREAATTTMLKVHGHDLGVVATLPTDEARSRLALARELVRTRSAPLRISLRRARAAPRER